MDLSESIVARSDQKNADDFLAGPQTFTIEEVKAGSAEQPVEVHLVESPGKPWKPSKSMRRVLVAAWGPQAAAYAGRRIRLYTDPTVKYGGQVMGGIKVSHLSGLDEPLTLSLTATRGKRAPHKVEPLTEAPDQPVQSVSELIEQCAGNTDSLRALYRDQQAAGATPDDLNQIKAAATKESN